MNAQWPYSIVAGVHKSDVVVILATESVLTRPWCLMEMWEAAVTRVPIVLFPVVNGGWSLEDARTLLSDLMGQMHGRNPECMNEVMAHVGKQGVTNVRYYTPHAHCEVACMLACGWRGTLSCPSLLRQVLLILPHPVCCTPSLCQVPTPRYSCLMLSGARGGGRATRAHRTCAVP